MLAPPQAAGPAVVVTHRPRRLSSGAEMPAHKPVDTLAHAASSTPAMAAEAAAAPGGAPLHKPPRVFRIDTPAAGRPADADLHTPRPDAGAASPGRASGRITGPAAAAPRLAVPGEQAVPLLTRVPAKPTAPTRSRSRSAAADRRPGPLVQVFQAPAPDRAPGLSGADALTPTALAAEMAQLDRIFDDIRRAQSFLLHDDGESETWGQLAQVAADIDAQIRSLLSDEPAGRMTPDRVFRKNAPLMAG